MRDEFDEANARNRRTSRPVLDDDEPTEAEGGESGRTPGPDGSAPPRPAQSPAVRLDRHSLLIAPDLFAFDVKLPQSVPQEEDTCSKSQ